MIETSEEIKKMDDDQEKNRKLLHEFINNGGQLA